MNNKVIKGKIVFLFMSICVSIFASIRVSAGPPEVLSVLPAKGACHVKPDVRVEITFDKGMDRKSVEDSFITIPSTEGQFSWQDDTFMFTPARPLLPSTQYQVVFNTGVKDVLGISLRMVLTSFSTIDQIVYPDRHNIWVATVGGSDRYQITHDVKSYHSPCWLPRNEQILYEFDCDLWIIDWDGSNAKQLTHDSNIMDHEFLLSPDGELIIYQAKDGSIWRVNTDGTGLRRLVGKPEGLDFGNSDPFVWSPDSGRILFNKLNEHDLLDIWSMGADGTGQNQLTENAEESNDDGFKFSPDGKLVAYVLGGALWVMDADGKNRLKISRDIGLCEDNFQWSPDSSALVFCGDYDIWRVGADGGYLAQLTTGGNSNYPCWSSDGKLISFNTLDERSSTNNLWVIEADGSSRSQLTKQKKVVGYCEWSPDGGSIAFWSVEGPGHDLWIVGSATGQAQRLTSPINRREKAFPGPKGHIPRIGKRNRYIWSR